jgi:DNA-binding NtrC family response regulator
MIKSVVLVCPDDVQATRMLRVLVAEFDVSVFKTGQDALDFIRESPDQEPLAIVDSAILDLSLDDLVGRIKIVNPSMVVLALMASSDPALIINAVKSGVSEIISKPASDDDLLGAVRKAFDHDTLISHLRHQLVRVSENTLRNRIATFRRLMESKKARSEGFNPSDIPLLLSTSDEIPIATLYNLIESTSLKVTSNLLNYRPHVLIVEDEPLLRDTLFEIMEQNFDVTAVKTAEEGIDAIESNVHFDLILLDIMLPGIHGDEIVKDIKDRCPKSHIVMVTGSNDSALIVRCLVSGASDYILKPFDVERLTQKTGDLIQTQLTFDWVKNYTKEYHP